MSGRRSYAEVEPRAVKWLVPGVIPLRTSTIVAGVGGLGKSTFLAAVSSRVSRGDLGYEPAAVIVVSYEDTAEEIWRPRLEAAGADLTRVFEILERPEDGGPIILPRDFERLESEVSETAAKLVIVDPLLASIDLALDAHKDQHARAVLAKMQALAERRACAAVGVLHLNKNPSKDAYLRVSSSTGFYNAVRSVVLVVPDPDEPEEHRLVAQVKSNWSRRAPVQRHVLEAIELPHIDPETGAPIVTSRMRFLEEAEGVDRDAILGEPVAERGERTGAATEWLKAALADGGWHESSSIKQRAKQTGITERTLQRAAESLDVDVEAGGFPRTTKWRLPQSRRIPYPASGATEGGPSSKGIAPQLHPVAPSALRVEDGATVGVGNGCTHPNEWKARDGRWYCDVCYPALSGEVIARRAS